MMNWEECGKNWTYYLNMCWRNWGKSKVRIARPLSKDPTMSWIWSMCANDSTMTSDWHQKEVHTIFILYQPPKCTYATKETKFWHKVTLRYSEISYYRQASYKVGSESSDNGCIGVSYFENIRLHPQSIVPWKQHTLPSWSAAGINFPKCSSK